MAYTADQRVDAYIDALASTLPHNRCAVFRGLDHGGSADVGPANRGGKPENVAPAIRSFFTQP